LIVGLEVGVLDLGFVRQEPEPPATHQRKHKRDTDEYFGGPNRTPRRPITHLPQPNLPEGIKVLFFFYANELFGHWEGLRAEKHRAILKLVTGCAHTSRRP
jgi:hypothetical protein